VTRNSVSILELRELKMTTKNPIFCAIDMANLDQAHAMASRLKPHVGGIKLGLEFFLAHGPAGYRRMAELGLPIFLDLKLHDIPNTVAGAVASLLSLRPDFMTLHASGGKTMMRAAVEAAAGAKTKPKLLGVTVLTSIDGADLEAIGQGDKPALQVQRLAKLAKSSGLDGVVCSPEEVKHLRAGMGSDFILMVPGIRPTWAAQGDQKRVMTPREAMQAGATYLVIGRPITSAENPAYAAKQIMEEIVA
jgi:orotidine-5'-phosphate decarboxylase